MTKKFTLSLTVLSAALLFGLPAYAEDDVVEVMLVDRLDEPRGYCLDIAGGRGKDAPLDQGLQAHTCYNYTGQILEDQGFEKALIESGEFKLPYFDVCATEEGKELVLEACTGSPRQSFEFLSDGRIVLGDDRDQCLTVSSTEKTEGRGGTPIHVMRPLTFQACDSNNAAYQTWMIQANN
ncbi:MAG: hypothetical protein AAF724_11850 [Pseudomonadota bacterium]